MKRHGIVYSVTNPNNQKYFGYLSKDFSQEALDSYIKGLFQHDVFGEKLRKSVQRFGPNKHEIKILVRTAGEQLVKETHNRQHRFRRISLNCRLSPKLHRKNAA